MISQRTLFTIVMVLFIFAQTSLGSSMAYDGVHKGEYFLVNILNPGLGLLPEYPGAKVYWLFHDNYLASKILTVSRPQISQRIMTSIHREGVGKEGKLELIFGEAEKPLPFHEYRLIDVRRDGDKTIRTEVLTDRVLDGWASYADLLLLASIAETNRPIARQQWEAAMKLWDGKGFLDAAARHDQRYSTYKLGLALLAASRLSPRAEPPRGLLEKLLEFQDASGGWVTDYDAAGKKIGVANVETTCLCILGIKEFTPYAQSPGK